ncbi:PD-(D/E)XK nuclease family protein [Actinoplanes sp. Pm04-4]|uniref:PD-(D/E)XK nuclease family protein n=1 Tax=Paractinoplanes pyxinae TaxID=2997416 RepID=A0ABT4AYR9_9ACTN|nr:PD-(D/E)XK nuclease family protein [Actinoplanes pyxinae]MCY1139397.1 PD-(D/E)XK nuclease family protein [Actinoplanes pyxinae]
MQTNEWSEIFAEMAQAWERIGAADRGDVVAWEAEFQVMRAERDRLVQLGRWTREPADLMSVARVHRRELAHSAVLRWLCDPSGSHALGEAFLERLLKETGDVPETLTDARTFTEVVRERSRADIVISGNGWRLIAELKVDASESKDQCQRVFEDWRGDPGTRFVFLTLSGRNPITATTSQAQEAWRGMAWSKIADLLDDAIRSQDDTVIAPAVQEYRRTLQALVGRRPRHS